MQKPSDVHVIAAWEHFEGRGLHWSVMMDEVVALFRKAGFLDFKICDLVDTIARQHLLDLKKKAPPPDPNEIATRAAIRQHQIALGMVRAVRMKPRLLPSK